jgi:hypothetical protein
VSEEEKDEGIIIIEQISRLVNGDGDSCDFGCSQNDVPEMITLAKKMFPSKPYRVVTYWCWGDFDIPTEQIEGVKQRGVEPSFIYASSVTEDEVDPANEGFCVKTSLLVEFHLNCLFVTRNTVYILSGKGSRMKVKPAAYNSLFF